MQFIQILEYRTSKYDELEKLVDEWRAATEGKRTVRRTITTRDRNDPDRYITLVFFDDYDSAMANSNLPATGELGQKQNALLDAPMTFTDLDVVAEQD